MVEALKQNNLYIHFTVHLHGNNTSLYILTMCIQYYIKTKLVLFLLSNLIMNCTLRLASSEHVCRGCISLPRSGQLVQETRATH